MLATTISLFLWSILCLGSAAPAQKQGAWMPLFNGTDLSGWEIVGEGDWGVRDGCIVVVRPAGVTRGGWLVTRREFGDYKLRLKFKSMHVPFNSGILFRDPAHGKLGRPAFSGFECQLYQSDEANERNGSGAIYDLARSFPPEIAADTWVDVEIHCVGDHIVSFLNGRKMSEAHSRRSYSGAIGLQRHGGTGPVEFWWKDIDILELPPAARPDHYLEEEMEQAPGDFRDVPASRNLEEGFDVYRGGGAAWTLKDGVLRVEKPGETCWIFTRESFSDFILTLEFRVGKGGSGAVGIRFPWPQGGGKSADPAVVGYECAITDAGGVNTTGSIHNLARAYESDAWKSPIYRSGAWNEYRIYAMGDHIVTYVNNRKTAEIHDSRSPAGRIGFKAQGPAEFNEFRNIRIKPVMRGQRTR